MQQDKNLRVVLGFAKVAKVFAMIFFVLIIVAGALGVISLLITLSLPTSKLLSHFSDIPPAAAQILSELPSLMIPTIIFLAIICAAIAVVFKMSYNYYKRTIADGTPFTEGGAKQLRTLGIVRMSVSVGIALLGQIYIQIISPFLTRFAENAIELANVIPGLDISYSGDLSTSITSHFSLGYDFWLGLAFLALSFLLAHGAMLRSKAGASEEQPAAPAKAPETEWVPVPPYSAGE